MKSRLIPILLGALLLGCQSADEMSDRAQMQTQPIDTEGMASGCFFVREVTNFEVVNRVNLIVYAPNRSRAFLLQISPPAIDSRSTFGILFIDRGPADRICGRPGERLAFDGTLRGNTYTIIDVRRLTEEQLDSIRPGRSAPAAVEPATKSPGAEVETDVTPADEAGNASE